MSKPQSIHLNPELTTNETVLRNWSAFQYTSTLLSVTESTSLEVQTDCGVSKFVLRRPSNRGHVSAVFGDPYYGTNPGEPVQLPAYTNISRQLPGMVNNLAEFSSFHALGVLGDFWYEFSPQAA